ncbi:unnamed protein product [Didymodactylos carnosus]|uniref:AIG1-type G domain-containing protein n=1 Tax=Didymodactylos carnosus TaxID=1234261 RepID=A0A8S2UE29_9BILA|nr:unnamed protein product [Didymodactylos carnosus]CAF4339052.1 unnamed protein product [Didymodactylos carnosus]
MSECGLIILGNSGAGKSFIANILLNEESFVHECSSTSVTHETEYRDICFDGHCYSIFNIPGLVEADQARIELNKQEIYKAFQLRPLSVVLFVFNGGAGGRLKDEDIVAYEAINSAYNFGDASMVTYVIIDYDALPANRKADYDARTAITLQKLLNKTHPIRVCFLNRINDLSDDNAKDKLRAQLASFLIQCSPHNYEKHGDISLRAEDIRMLKQAIKEMQDQFEKQLVVMQRQIEQKQQEFDEYKKTFY